jgi:hypothetical protein
MRWSLLLMSVLLLVVACAVPTSTPRSIAVAPTQRPFPTFGPTRTRTPKPTPRVTATETLAAEPVISVATIMPTATLRALSGRSTGPSLSTQAARPDKLARADVPSIMERELIKAGVRDPSVYWFTFDEGDREVALMVQYASPLRWQPGYLDMLRAAKLVVGRYYLAVDPPLYSAFIAGVDITGSSDITVRLRRHTAEKYARGDIGADDFVNNYFEFANVWVQCTADGICLAKMATPPPEFNFPFPFPTPTKKP